jgi:polyhydroxyalkanoate synthase
MNEFIDPLGPFGSVAQALGAPRQWDAVRRGMLASMLLPRPPVGLTPHAVILRQNKLELRYYAPTGPAVATPVVIIPSMINRAYICDLEPDRSLVAGLARLGHPVYLVDWGVPGPEDAAIEVGDVLLNLLHRAVERTCRHAGAAQVFLLGYCQGGTLGAMYTALRPARVRGLATFTAPVHFAHGGRFRQFVDPATFDVDRAIDADGLVSIDVMKAGFRLLDPMGNLSKYAALAAVLDHPRELARALARERWLEENVPMPGAFAREFIRCAYQEDRLMHGGWVVQGEAVDLGAIRCPLFVAAARKDFIAPMEAVLPLAQRTSSADVVAHTLETGHIGVVVGSFGPKVFYPLLDRWFREH